MKLDGTHKDLQLGEEHVLKFLPAAYIDNVQWNAQCIFASRNIRADELQFQHKTL